MRSQVRGTAIEWQRAPAAAERGNTPITILQVEQPTNATRRGFGNILAVLLKPGQGEKGAGGVIGIGNPPGLRGPSPSSRSRIGVGMTCDELLGQQEFY